MKLEEIKKTVEAFQSDHKAAEMLEGCDKTDKIEAIVETANKLGYDLTETDLREYIKCSEEEVRQQTEAAKNDVSDLPDDDLDAVAGGKGRDDCRYTFEHMENCFLQDGCNEVFFYYNGYILRDGKTGGGEKKK